MQKPLRIVCLLAFLAGMAGWLPLKGQSGFHDYLKPAEINARLEGLQAKYPSQVKVKQLAVSPGGIPVNMLEIGPSGGDRPAVLVVANAEGTYPIASLGALYLADRILAEPDKYSELNWYIVPCLNPDGALRYFSVPLYMDGRNARKVNEDLDDQMDEDGYNDLNGDGYITRMRVGPIRPKGRRGSTNYTRKAWMMTETESTTKICPAEWIPPSIFPTCSNRLQPREANGREKLTKPSG